MLIFHALVVAQSFVLRTALCMIQKNGTMSRILYSLLLTAFVVIGCSSETGGDSLVQGDLILSADKTSINGGRVDTVHFKVLFNGEDVTHEPGCVIKSHEGQLDGSSFVGNYGGQFGFKAIYKEVLSNEVQINVNVPITWYARNHTVFYATSVHCGSCPTGAAVISEATQKYPQRILPLYFHGYYGGEDPFMVGITSRIQTWLYAIGFPTISINNQGALKNGFFDLEAIEPFVQAPANATTSAVAIATSFDQVTRELQCELKALITNPVYKGQDVRMVAFLIEDNLPWPQMTADGVDKNYIHHDVVRTPLIGSNIFGEKIEETFIATHQEYAKNIVLKVLPEWNAENSYIQAYLLHQKGGSTTKEDTVMNVCRVKVGQSSVYELIK